jgi:hypothetical protein
MKMPQDEDKRKHLELIQGVVGRLAGNSFSIKGWAVGLIAILGGFAAKDADPRFVFGLWLPMLCFWGLDAFYLREEKLFRKLYQAAVIDSKDVPLYSMDTKPFVSQVGSTVEVAFSPSILWLHIPILIFVLALSTYSLHRMAHAEKGTGGQPRSGATTQPTP